MSKQGRERVSGVLFRDECEDFDILETSRVRTQCGGIVTLTRGA